MKWMLIRSDSSRLVCTHTYDEYSAAHSIMEVDALAWQRDHFGSTASIREFNAQTESNYDWARWKIIELPTNGSYLETIVNRLLNDNRPNLDNAITQYDEGYTEGYHDALVDVMLQVGIETDEIYMN